MARKRDKGLPLGEEPAKDLRHDHVTRTNNPPAGLAGQGSVEPLPRQHYAYDPHRPPTLRFDATGRADRLGDELTALLAKSQMDKLEPDEAERLADALRQREPWLEWAGKRERTGFDVDPVALHIHERISTRALLRIVARQDVQRSLFGDPEQAYHQAIQFYRHAVNWSNRLILGNNLVVMDSMAKRENMAGKFQMIYLDPPYGIRFPSNFQPEIGRRDVKDKEQDFTREPEMVKAYRDTWNLGVHSYLSYLRDRLLVANILLADTGSVFVQIGEENVHLVRSLLDEVFGNENYCSIITFKKTTGTGSFSGGTNILPAVSDYLLWYAKDRGKVKYYQIYKPKFVGGVGGTQCTWIEERSGRRRTANNEEMSGGESEGQFYSHDNLTSQTTREAQTTVFEVDYQSRSYRPGKGGWKTNVEGMKRLLSANRLVGHGETLRYVRFMSDFPLSPLTGLWDDTTTSGFADPKVYVVQTNSKVIERCLLMTTDPGDLVLDPTGGSGTTAYVAEQWGRRWISIDTSRVAVAIARQRLLTAKYDYYKLRPINAEDRARNPDGAWLSDPDNRIDGPCTFQCKTVPHITLKSIAQNAALDPIFARHEAILDDRLTALNAALATVPKGLSEAMEAKLLAKQRRKDKADPVTEADERRWRLPKDGWREWEVPFDTDSDWPRPLQDALVAYRAAWRSKMDEVNACIAASAEQEELVDQPEIVRNIVRVAGPFTVEAVQPSEEPLDAPSPIGGSPEEDLEGFDPDNPVSLDGPGNAEAYLDKMLRLLRADGVRFPNNKQATFTRLDPLDGGILHAEGEWHAQENGSVEPRTVAVAFGPQYGPITSKQVDDCLRSANRARLYDDLVFAGFAFDATAQAIIQENEGRRVVSHLAFIRPDVNPELNGLLKVTPQSQLFTVFGMPRTKLEPAGDGEYRVRMEGVDVYNPVTNEIIPTGADKVAAWFVDSDYDGRTFCICQAFFPNRSAWDKLGRALKGIIDEAKFEAFSGVESLPFPAPKGPEPKVAVKVIDPRGNEVMRVHSLA